MITHDTEVLVAGLGPVGATAALSLARQGIAVAAIEPLSSSATDLRASTYHAPTLEILDDLGAAETLFSQGLKAPIYQYRDRQTGEVFSFDMAEIADRTRFPFRIQCEQHRVTANIVAQLKLQPSATVLQGQRVLFVEQDADGVTAYVESANAVERWRAKHLVAADGASSVVRKVLGLQFPGFTYDEKFVCFSTEYPIEQAFDDLSYVNYISDPQEWMVVLRVPGLWRILVPAPTDLTDEQLVSDDYKNGVFRRMLGHDRDIVTRHRTIYRAHQRVCERFAVGNILLVGDSAHLNSPMGGFGMNSGIHDAMNASEKLVRVLRHGADAAQQIALYERQRKTVTHEFVQAQTIENTRLMRDGWANARAQRSEAMNKLMNDAAARRTYLLKQSMFTSLEQAAAIA
ncbi:FAD-dependent oxidoreductase [Roseateles sp. DC23W]|uniref:FAD-dependent oxidoreductase n=1 Tax=Pelomonas dachongensis TaxID=3299029 RepID=A0ABW7ESK7_9BURK